MIKSTNTRFPQEGQLFGVKMERDRSYQSDIFLCLAEDENRVICRRVYYGDGNGFNKDGLYIFHRGDMFEPSFKRVDIEELEELDETAWVISSEVKFEHISDDIIKVTGMRVVWHEGNPSILSPRDQHAYFKELQELKDKFFTPIYRLDVEVSERKFS